MINFITTFKNSNLYYFFKIIINNYIKLFIFLIFGLIVGYFLFHNAERQLILKKKISPIISSSHLFEEVIAAEIIFNDFIRLLKEKINEEEYYEIFEFNSKSNIIKEPTKVLNKIQSNISYQEYLKLSQNFDYLKERIDYSFDIYHVSKKLIFKKDDDDLKARTSTLKKDFDKYLLINDQILRYKIFNTLWENPSFYKKILNSFNQDLVLIDNQYLMEKLYEKNSNEIEKITRLLNKIIFIMQNKADTLKIDVIGSIPDLNTEGNPQTILNNLFSNASIGDGVVDKGQGKTWVYDGEKNWITINAYSIKMFDYFQKTQKNQDSINEEILEKIIENKTYNFKGKNNYTYDEVTNFARAELERIFYNYFKHSVNGINNEFEIKILEKNLYFYLIICSLISIGALICFLLVRDFIQILKKD